MAEIKIENTQVFGFEASIRGMRNPRNSWANSDSCIDPYSMTNAENFYLGEKDAVLSRGLTKKGTEHCKHLRMIQVWADMTLPRYIWQEMDTYKFMEKISCSTVYKLASRPVTKDDFYGNAVIDSYIDYLNAMINVNKTAVNKKRKKETLVELKDVLMESYLQKRTICTNYQQILSVDCQREGHLMPQWDAIRSWGRQLPYFKELTGVE